MICSSCQHENPAAAKFCNGCGSSLAAKCSSCGLENPAGARFCNQCGNNLLNTPTERAPADYTPKHLSDKILQSKSALEGERKQVTVMFADIKGSMDLAAQLGPEGWHRVLDRFFEILGEGVHRFEGTINQYTGDGIMALFGAPIAHEDHAQRACFAALHLSETLNSYADELRRTEGISLSTRIGLNSGEVIVGKIGDDLRMDYTAQGHTVGLAQRMESVAEPNACFMTAHTARLVEGYFQLRDLGDFEIKGSDKPLRVYKLEDIGALRTRLDSSRSRGFSKFVGRDTEMDTLDAALEAAISGNGQVVGVVADAGTGKSRLCLEFVERCKARGIRVNSAHCPAHGKTVPYLPLHEMLRDIFEIEARDSDHEARRKIAGELMLLDETFQGILPILFEFMGVADPTNPAPEMSPEGRQEKLFAFLRHLVEERSNREPTILFLDDLHWIDPGSDTFLADSVKASASTRTLWLVNFRPEYDAEWMNRSFYQQLPLRPLGAEAIAALLSDLIGNDPSTAGLPERIHERTSGNPFFIEEIVQSLVENGSLVGSKGAYQLVTADSGLELPSTVQSVLAARLDRLPEREKRLLQTASVIGKEFSQKILKAVIATAFADNLNETDLAEAIAGLSQAEFIFEASLYPEVEYAFKHPLTQEVAYTSQLESRRTELHRSVARGIEALEADKLEERAALLAYHYEQAGESLTAAEWYERAAVTAGFDSPLESSRHWERVAAVLQSAPVSEKSTVLRLRAISAILNFSWRLGVEPERVTQYFDEGISLARDRDDVSEQVCLNYALGLSYALNGNPSHAITIYKEAARIAHQTGEPELIFSAHTAYEFALWLLGNLDDALKMNEDQIALSDVEPGLGRATIGISSADALWHRGVMFTDIGRFEEAHNALQQGNERALKFGDNEVASWGDFWTTRLFVRSGDMPRAIAMGRKAIDSSEKIGSVLARVGAYCFNGLACVLAEEWNAARENLERSLELSSTNHAGQFFDVFTKPGLAEALLGLGIVDAALEQAYDAVETATNFENPVGEVAAQLALARVLLATGSADTLTVIQSALDRAKEIVQETGAHSYEPQILVERARLAKLLGDQNTFEKFNQDAQRIFIELGAAGHAERAQNSVIGKSI